jgi:hypothetical protein
VKLLTYLFVMLCLCAFETLHPWVRGTLARPELQWQSDPMEISLQAQINASKEASSGGQGAAGGGCGCN